MRWLLAGVPILIFLREIAGIALHPEKYMWDHRTWFSAVATANPYAVGFVYPPFVLPVFRAFLPLGADHAYLIYLGLRCAALGLLLWIWIKGFLKDVYKPEFWLFCLLAFYATIDVDFKAGNVSVYEQCLLWSGFYFFTKNRLGWFSFFVFLAACFKITPLFFLVLLLFSLAPNAIRYFIGTVAAFFGAFLVSYFCNPVLMANFFSAAALRTGERGVTSPSLLNIIRDASDLIAAHSPLHVPSLLQFGFFALIACAISYVSWSVLWKKASARVTVFVTCLTYMLILPRDKDYSYILLIPPAYFIIRRATTVSASALLFVLAILLTQVGAMPPYFDYVYTLVWTYFPALLALGAWCLYVAESRKAQPVLS